jgi:hypothetical protein
MKKIKIVSIALVLLFFITILVIKDDLIWKHDDSGGWTVGLVKLNRGDNEFDIFSKIENGDVLKIDKSDVKIEDSVIFLADPFLFKHNDSMFLFVETQIKGRGAIITAFYINNLGKPQFLGTALREPFHLSYPQIVKFGNDIFMIPESQAGDSSFVYQCVSMPLVWRRVGNIYPSRIKDPTIWKKTDTSGYLYFGQKGKLYKSDLLFVGGRFKIGEKVYVKTGTAMRPGGRILKKDSITWLTLQDNTRGYGTSLMVYPLMDNGQINREIEPKMVLTTSKVHSEFSHGMHHYCLDTLSKDEFLVAVDGNNKVSNALKMNVLVKYNYLNLWDFVFGDSREPWYPFNE